MGAKQWISKGEVLELKYDFADDGGAVGAVVLGDLPDNFLVTEMYVVIDTTITSGGTPTLVLGEDGAGDDDGYFANFFGTPSAGVVLKGGGALITDGIHIVDSAKDGLELNIGTAAVTAGAFRVYARGVQS